jgi:hypothetical protein
MTGRPLTDARISAGLRAHLPAAAMPGLHDRIRSEVLSTPQQRPLPRLVAGLGDADPVARRGALLVAAALLLLVALVGVLISGGLPLLQRDPLDDLSIDPPADVPGFVLSTYSRLQSLEPVAIQTTDGTGRGAIYVAADGDIRIERFSTREATEPDELRIVSGADIFEIVTIDSQRMWAKTGGIADDPRIWILTVLSPSALDDGFGPGCEMTPDGVEGLPGVGWTHVAVETVAGRQAHHVRCQGDLWIDVATGLPLRVRSADGARTIEVTSVAFGPQAEALFSAEPPAGMAVAPPGVYECSADPHCLMSPAPVVTPAPASGQPTGPVDVNALVTRAREAYARPPAFDATVERYRLLFDGTERWRYEFGLGTADRQISLFGDGYLYRSETREDGTTVWVDRSFHPDGPRGWPLWPPETACPGGWRHVSVDLVRDREADHIACPGAQEWTDFWIDRRSGLTLRIQGRALESGGIIALEVVKMDLAVPAPSLFELPPDAVVVPAFG